MTPAAVPSVAMPRISANPWTVLRALALAVVAAALLGTGLTASSAGDLQGQISATRSAADTLQSQIAADSKRIATTTGGLDQARAQLSADPVAAG